MSERPGTPANPPIAAVLTPGGRGAVATVRFDGDARVLDELPTARFRAVNGKPVVEQPVGRICFGRWGGIVDEDVVLCRLDGQTVEIHCHGGAVAVQRILDDLAAAGCTVQSWQELATGQMGVLEAECADALARATTLRTATILLQQQSGVLKAAFEDLRAASVPEPTRAGSGEPPSEVADWTSDVRAQLIRKLDQLLNWSDFGLHLTQPWNVVLTGRPNVGKSSLINVMVGYARSIVYERPGTTRDVVTAETAFDGWPIRFADTAGIRDDADRLEAAGIERARQQLAEADCRVLLVDTSRPPHPDDRRLLADWPDAVLVAHKCDLPNTWGDAVAKSALPVSSLTGAGIESLAKTLIARLVPEVPFADTAVPISERQITLLRAARAAAVDNDKQECRQALARLPNADGLLTGLLSEHANECNTSRSIIKGDLE